MTYVSRHEPWKHQHEALDKMRDRPAFALLMAMRTGKTKTLLDNWGALVCDDECDDLLVIAPAGVYRTWETAINDHIGEALRPKILVFTWSAKQDGAKAQLKQDSFMRNRTRQRILLVNVEALSRVQRARDLCTEFLSQRRCMLAVDESTVIKNPIAERTKYINRKLKELATHRRILSGLPTPKSPLDLYSQFEFLDSKILGFTSYRSFRARYAVTRRMNMSGRSFDIVVGYRDVEELQQRIQPHSFRVQLEDCYDLPPKMYTVREVKLTPEQERIYREIKQFATSEIEENAHVTATVVITQILRMHQVLCGHVGTEDGKFLDIPENRTKTLIELLEEHDGKGIVWCSYDADVRKVSLEIENSIIEQVEEPTVNSYGKEEYRKPDESKLRYVARFWGGNKSSREDEEKKFLNDPQCRYMVATAAAGGRGRTWTVADLVVYYSNTADLEHRSQSEERAQGVNKTKSVLYVDLVAPGTVDEKMLQTLRNKIDMAGAITSDNWKEWVV